jgi:hypothetical protein
MSRIDPNSMRNWNDGDTMHESDYESERLTLITAINDNYARLIKSYFVLNADGTVKSTQNLDTAINFIKFKENSHISLSLDTATSVLTIDVKPGSVQTSDLADSIITTSKMVDGAITQPKLGIDIQASVGDEYTWTATDGQTAFTLPPDKTYSVGVAGSLTLVVGGVEQSLSAFTQTSPSSITTSEGVYAGTKVTLRWRKGLMPTTTVGHQSTHQKGGLDSIRIDTLDQYQELVADKIGILSKNIISPLSSTYGCKGDGTTEDATGLQSAVNAVFAITSGKKVLDLGGATFLISTPITLPLGTDVKIRNGKILASSTFPTNDYLFKVTTSTSSNGYGFEDNTFENLIFDPNHKGGGLYLNNFQRITMDDVRFRHYSLDGLKTGSNGHELITNQMYFSEYIYGETVGTYSGYGMNINNPDNQFVNTVITSAFRGLHLNASYNIFDDIHVYGGSDNGLYLTQNAAHTKINGLYQDSVKMTIENPWFTEIEGKFLHATTDTTFAFIVLKPMSAGVGIQGFKVNNSSFVNNKVGGVDYTVSPFKLDTSVGTFAAAQVKQCSIEKNSFSDVTPMYTRFTKTVYLTGATAFTADFTSMIPFGAIQKSLYTFKADSGAYVQNYLSAIASYTATVTTASAVNGTAWIEMDVNYDT